MMIIIIIIIIIITITITIALHISNLDMIPDFTTYSDSIRDWALVGTHRLTRSTP